MMKRDFALQKRLILGGVLLLVVADIALAVYSWKLASSPHTPQKEFALQSKNLKLLRGDIERAQGIQKDMPNIQKDCDGFEQSLFPANTGYSSVTADLGSISKKAGLRIDDLSFKQKEIPNRNLTEVAMDATVSGDYKNIIQFLNGLQRSQNLYEVDNLSLASEAQGQGPAGAIRVSMHLKTYFRTA
jgi:type IV pilus assembly protein PilO